MFLSGCGLMAQRFGCAPCLVQQPTASLWSRHSSATETRMPSRGKTNLHTFIHYLLLVVQHSLAGGWRLIQLTLGERWGAHWTGHSSQGSHIETIITFTPIGNFVTNSPNLHVFGLSPREPTQALGENANFTQTGLKNSP